MVPFMLDPPACLGATKKRGYQHDEARLITVILETLQRSNYVVHRLVSAPRQRLITEVDLQWTGGRGPVA